ncbi:MAG: xylulokinase [Fusobacteriaceae bacterium]|jgi:xylulokinase|nr:xylulokinase [Fusobacteriaceae bacterium]
MSLTNYVAGIDLGTSSVKVLIMSEKGDPVGLGQAEYDIHTPKMLYAEQDTEAWWEATKAAAAEALREAKVPPEAIAAVGFSGQMHGLVALDKHKRPLAPAIIWMDQRSAREAADIKTLAAELMETELCNQPAAGMLIATLLWLKRNQAELYDKIACVMLPKDYIRFRLTGLIGAEYSDASATLAFSVKNNCWCRDLIRRAGLREDIWPDIYESTDIAGPVCKEAAAETGFSEKTLVVYGAADSAAQLTGNGVVDEGVVSCNIGTGSQLATVVKTPLFDKEMRVQTWRYVIPGRWFVQGGTLNGGSALNWLKNKALQTAASYAELDARAAEIPAGSEGLIMIPFLAGERTPFLDPYAKGVYFGLSMKHEQAHLVRATMEGIVYNLKECAKVFDEMRLSNAKVISSGGAAKSALWRQIQADILGMPVYTTKTKEEACQGAAILAAVGCGMFQDVREACRAIVRVNDRPTEPVAENRKIYSDRQAVFAELYRRIKDLYPKILT